MFFPLIPKIIKLDGGRLYLPRNLVPDWDAKTPLFLVPLNWKRAVAIPDLNQSEAWYLCDANETKNDDWVVHPNKVRAKPENNEGFPGYWNQFIFDLHMEEHVRAWRLLLPKMVRDLGWFSKKGGKVVAIPDPDGLALLTETAFRLLLASLPEQWEDPD
jgi:hypothetical protein